MNGQRATRSILFSVLTLAMVISLLPASSALRNPAAVYCDALGHNYSVERHGEDEFGYCTLPDGKKVEAWAFLLGEEEADQSFCVREGLELKVVEGWERCGRLFTSRCVACVLKNGTEVEMTRLMGLTFAETTCGDGHCGFPEDWERCPEDCPAGGYDMACNDAADGRCDPDCADLGKEDPDCGNGYAWPLLLIGAFLIIAALAALLFLRRPKKGHGKRAKRS